MKPKLSYTRLALAAALVLFAIVGCQPDHTQSQEFDADVADSAPTLELADGLERGRYAVGFRKERLSLRIEESSTRSTPSGLDLYLWFPAEESESQAGTSMAFSDYYRVQEAEEPSTDDLREWLTVDMTSPPGLDPRALDSVMQSPMWAKQEVEIASGTHPLILWSYRDSIPTMHAVLNEYLASHGFVVAFAWPIDNAPPFPWQQGLDLEQKRVALDDQIHLLEEVLDTLSGRSPIDGQRVAVLAWSYGGESATGLQQRRSSVKLALGIDATLVSGWVYQPGREPELDVAHIAAPYVLLRNGRPRIDSEMSSSVPLMKQFPAGAWFVRFNALSHGNFNVPGGLIPGVLGLEEVSSWAVGGEDARLGYQEICRYTLGFLNLYLEAGTADPERWGAARQADFVDVERYESNEEI